ncbi:MAG: hypothetical protein R3A43_04945 [Bacteroidia bacterium]
MSLTNVTVIIELICVVFWILAFGKFQKQRAYLILIGLLILVGIEVYSHFIWNRTLGKVRVESIFFLYNTVSVWLVSQIYCSFFLIQIKDRPKRNWIYYVAIPVWIYFIFGIVFKSPPHFFKWDFFLLTMCSCQILLTIGIFLAYLLQSDNNTGIARHLPFWVAVAFILFYTGSIPLLIVKSIFPLVQFDPILFGLNVMQYGVLIFAVLWSKNISETP